MRRPIVVVFLGWTLLIWAARIKNIWADDDLGTAAKWGNTALAGSFVVLALLVVGLARWGSPTARAQRALRVLAGWTAGVWLVRSAGILVDSDWSAGFKVVHTTLAAVSVALAYLAARAPSNRATGAVPASRRTT